MVRHAQNVPRNVSRNQAEPRITDYGLCEKFIPIVDFLKTEDTRIHIYGIICKFTIICNNIYPLLLCKCNKILANHVIILTIMIAH
jgi:hypothetical protein